MQRCPSRLSKSVQRIIQFGLLVSTVSLSALADAEDVTVIEMFTSQGCYSCPAADKLLAKVAKNHADVLNLEFHVDYWNQLQYRSEGNWEDPFSAPEYTERQRRYSALKLRGENGVYTPQAVVNGVYGLVGSNKRAMRKGMNIDVLKPVSINIARRDANLLDIHIDNQAQVPVQVVLVSYLKKTRTTITSGENHGKVMENHNVVVDMRDLGSLAVAGEENIEIAYNGGENRGCAVLVQPVGLGPMLGAARCP